MLCYIISEIQLSNASVTATRIASLSNATKNIYLLIAVFFLTAFARVNSSYGYYVLICYIIPVDDIIPALTNTLFTVHPLLLYYAAFSTLISVSLLRGIRMFVAPILLFTAMVLGGFWSTQELSWGGWWNWDVLECGVGYFWVISAIIIHLRSKGSYAAKTAYALILLVIASLYTTLNKFGLATSIHSFVASRSTRNHHASILSVTLFVYLALTHRLGVRLWYYPALLLLSYTSLKWCIFLKKPIVYSYTFFYITVFGGKYFSRALHAALKLTFTATVFYNYTCYSLFYTTVAHKNQTCFNLTKNIWAFDINTYCQSKIVWRGMFLSKPQYLLNKNFSSYSTRGPNGRFVVSGFLK